MELEGEGNKKEEDEAFKDDGSFTGLPGSLDCSLITEEESVQMLYDWSITESDEAGSKLAPLTSEEKEEEKKDEQWVRRPMTAGKNHYIALETTLKEASEEAVRDVACRPATPTNVSAVIQSSQTQQGKKAAAFKWLAHHGYQAKLHQSLVTEARDYVALQQKAKLVDLRERQKEEVAWLSHQAKRYEAFLYLRERADGLEDNRLKEYLTKRDEVQAELVMLAHRWMY